MRVNKADPNSNRSNNSDINIINNIKPGLSLQNASSPPLSLSLSFSLSLSLYLSLSVVCPPKN